MAAQADRRHRLRLGRDARLAGARARDRAACAGVRQVRAADGSFDRAAFTFDREQDRYLCPAGKELKRFRRRRAAEPDDAPHADGFYRYRASKLDCDPCPLKATCCPGADPRKVMRSVHEGARDMARALAQEDEWITSRRERKKVEMLFAHLKRIMRLDRLRLRGPNGARDESTSQPPLRTFESSPNSIRSRSPL